MIEELQYVADSFGNPLHSTVSDTQMLSKDSYPIGNTYHLFGFDTQI